MKKRIIAALQIIGIAFFAASCSDSQSEVVTVANELNIFKSYQITQSQAEKLISEVEGYISSQPSSSEGNQTYTIYFKDVDTYPYFEGKVNVSISTLGKESIMTIAPDQLILKTSDSKSYNFEGTFEVRDVYEAKSSYRKEIAIQSARLVERLDSKGTVRPFASLNFTYLHTQENGIVQLSSNELVDAESRRGFGEYVSPSGEVVSYHVTVRLPIQKSLEDGSYIKGTLNFMENKVGVPNSQPIVAQFSKYGEQTITLTSSVGIGQNLALNAVSGL